MFSEYIRSVITVALCAFFSNLSVGSLVKSTSLSKGFKLITNLCVFSVILFPLITAIQNFDTDRFNITGAENDIKIQLDFDKLTEKEMSDSLYREIINRTGISVSDIGINIVYEKDKLTIKSITATVRTSEEKETVFSVIYELFGDETDIQIRTDEIEDYKEID